MKFTIVKTGLVLFLILGVFLFIVGVDWSAPTTTIKRVAWFGIMVSISGSLFMLVLETLGEKIEFLNRFFKKPLVEKIRRGLALVFLYTWLGIFSLWLLSFLVPLK
jgi:hypothetical protein